MNFKKIVCCTDFSDSSDNAFRSALELAKNNQASLDILHVIEPIMNVVFLPECGFPIEADQPTIMCIQEEMETRYGSKIPPSTTSKLIVREGHPSSEIIAYLKEVNADLVVTGTAGFSGMGLVVFGSVSRRIAHKSPCNVLIARQKESAI